MLGFFRLNKAIALPFKRNSQITFKTADQLDAERTQQLKNQDTDGDGLSDYDELYLYRTSPFLADTDSDGVPDGVEVANDSDPNCPKGRTCRQAPVFIAGGPQSDTGSSPPPVGSGVANGSTETDVNSDFPAVDTNSDTNAGADANAATNVNTNAPLVQGQTAQEQRILEVITEYFGDPTKLTTDKVSQQLETMSTADLRGFLTKLGIPKEALDKADDATLRKLLKETLDEIAAQNPPTSTTTQSTGGTGQ